MRNLFLFFIKHSFFFLFLFLEIFSLLLVVSNNPYQRSAFISASNGATAGILSAVSDVTDYFNLKNQNEQLAFENAILRSEIKASKLWSVKSFQQHSDSVKSQFYTYKAARIISNNFQFRNNYLILDKGSVDGVEPEMGVITSNGIVGIVKDVSKHFCTVISVLHQKSAIDARITSNGYNGTIYWPGGDYTLGQLKNIPSHAVLKVGDTIVTSGYSAIFPPEIAVGTIKDFEVENGENFFTINFKFSVDYNKLGLVYIIHNERKEELTLLNEGIQNE
jgi:rod shape-determining protein MreC